ncbi:MAG TPA: lipid-binding SYLF domain-containing protein [Candidatus Angelobacter sp.]|nr:lipid-binding SYLF domain-containing protein [Candidatus Angelobacter sp.]
MKSLLRVVLFALGLVNMAFASEAAANRLQDAATVLNDIMATPDKGIPSEIMGSAKCIAVIPSLLKGGFVIGAMHGRGMATCRLANGWSAPAPLTTTGGSFGFQIGGQAVDVIMVVMNDRGMQALLTNKFKLGADASVAAGPVGRQAEGSTDWKLNAEVLTYSRARGLFAGVSFNGAVIKQDEDATGELYGRMIDFKTILTGSVQMPRGADSFLAAVRKAAGGDTTPSSTTTRSPNPPPPSPAPVNPPPSTPTPEATPIPTPATEPSPAAEPTPAASPTPPSQQANGMLINNH